MEKELTFEEITKMKVSEFYDNYFEKYKSLIERNYYVHTKGPAFKTKTDFIELLQILFGGSSNIVINTKGDAKKIALAFLKNKEILDEYVDKLKKIKQIRNLFIEERATNFIYGFTRNIELNLLRIKNFIFVKNDSLAKNLIELSKKYYDNVIELRKLYDDIDSNFEKIENLGSVVSESLKNLNDFKKTVLDKQYNIDMQKFSLILTNRKAIAEKLKEIRLPKSLNELREITISDIENNNDNILEQYQNTKLLLSKQKQNEKIPRAI